MHDCQTRFNNALAQSGADGLCTYIMLSKSTCRTVKSRWPLLPAEVAVADLALTNGSLFVRCCTKVHAIVIQQMANASQQSPRTKGLHSSNCKCDLGGRPDNLYGDLSPVPSHLTMSQ